jgi:hypothetical protein
MFCEIPFSVYKPDLPIPWASPQHLLATIPENILPSRSPAPQFSGKLLLSMSEKYCNNRSTSRSLHPLAGSFR